jgi:Domain of unknown function (DUF6916)
MAQDRIVVTRRSLLRIGWQTAALVGVASACEGLPLWASGQQNLHELTAESFLPYEGRDLVFSRPVSGREVFSRSVVLKLVKVTTHERTLQIESQHPGRYQKRLRKPFSLTLDLQGGEPLGEGLHRLIHKDFSGCQLFLSQVSQPRPDGTLVYEAVFG